MRLSWFFSFTSREYSFLHSPFKFTERHHLGTFHTKEQQQASGRSRLSYDLTINPSVGFNLAINISSATEMRQRIQTVCFKQEEKRRKQRILLLPLCSQNIDNLFQ
jgi:hypothetical protein